MSPREHMNSTQATRRAFRLATRSTLKDRNDLQAHINRIQAARKMPGADPLQAALIDMLCSLPPVETPLGDLLSDAEIKAKLITHVRDALLNQADSTVALPHIHPFATRWCVVAIPSCNVPERARLSNVDDSRALAADAIAHATAGQQEEAQRFLSHCLGAHDTLAFMLAFSSLSRSGTVLSQEWHDAMRQLSGRRHA